MLDFPLKVRRNAWLGHGVALIVFGVAFAVRWWSEPAMEGLPFVTFFLAVLIVAAVAGTGPALTCAAFSFVAAWYFFVAPFGSFRLPWPQGPISLAFFLAVVGTQIALVHWLRLALERLELQRGAMETQAERHKLLYKELQHRVANGIQSVASALSAQASMSPEAQPALDEAAERLMGVAEVHRRLHDPDLGDQMGVMLDGMLRQLMISAGKSDVAVTVQVDAGTLQPETASLIGLIVAEAASNSIKHAFAGRFGGSIDISLLHIGEERLRLLIEDDGPGFKALAGDQPESLGVTIMRGFAERLCGTIRFGEAPAGGARISLEFPAR